MIRRATVLDIPLVQKILTHEKIYPSISDDASPARGDYRADHLFTSGDIFVLLDGIDKLFIFRRRSSIAWETHVACMPWTWGREALASVREAISWMFENTPCCKLIGEIPSYNKFACLFASWAGYRREGKYKDFIMKNGEVHDMILFGITKEEYQCHKQSVES